MIVRIIPFFQPISFSPEFLPLAKIQPIINVGKNGTNLTSIFPGRKPEKMQFSFDFSLQRNRIFFNNYIFPALP
jgi:hypothetical protein